MESKGTEIANALLKKNKVQACSTEGLYSNKG